MIELEKVPTLSELKKHNQNVSCVLFDMDGTLINTEHLHALALRDILAEFSLKLEAKELNERFVGIGDQAVYELLKSEHHLPIELSEYLNKKNTQFYFHLNLVSEADIISNDIQKLIKDIKGSSLKIGLVTASEKEVTKSILVKLRLENFFDVVVTSGDVTETKPSPIPYIDAAKYLNEVKENIIILEDSPTGLEAAKSFGAQTIIARWY